MIEADELRGPHLMLADVARDNRFAARQAVDFRHQVLRLDLVRRHFGVQRMLLLPLLDLSPPACARRRILALHLAAPSLPALRSASSSTRFTSPTIGISGVRILADLGRIDVHVNHLGVRSERGQPAGDAIVEAHAERDEQIGLGHAHVGRVAAVHAGHADEIRMRRSDSPPRPISVHTAGASMSSTSCAQFLGRPGGDDAAARVDERPLRFPDHLRRAPDLTGVAFGVNLVARQDEWSKPARSAPWRLEHVLGDVDQHRPGRPVDGDVERFVNRLRQIRQISSPGNCAWCRSA